MRFFVSAGESPADPVKGVPIRDFVFCPLIICNSSTSSFLLFSKGGM
jgi:hypothetical protein